MGSYSHAVYSAFTTERLGLTIHALCFVQVAEPNIRSDYLIAIVAVRTSMSHWQSNHDP